MAVLNRLQKAPAELDPEQGRERGKKQKREGACESEREPDAQPRRTQQLTPLAPLPNAKQAISNKDNTGCSHDCVCVSLKGESEEQAREREYVRKCLSQRSIARSCKSKDMGNQYSGHKQREKAKGGREKRHEKLKRQSKTVEKNE